MKSRKPKRAPKKVAPVVEIGGAGPVAVVPVSAEQGEAHTIRLNSNPNLRDAMALKATLIGALDVATAVSIDASAVERIDTATLQLLLAFVRDRQRMNLACQWIGVTTALSEAASMLGLCQALQLEACEAA